MRVVVEELGDTINSYDHRVVNNEIRILFIGGEPPRVQLDLNLSSVAKEVEGGLTEVNLRQLIRRFKGAPTRIN